LNASRTRLWRWPACDLVRCSWSSRPSRALNEHGIALFAISYDSIETLSAFTAKNRIEFSLLADEGSQVVTGDALEAGTPVWPESAPFHVNGLDEQF
jgi:hypothetical protein